MVGVKKVNPDDMVFWHCDAIHAVEKEHRGKGDSSVFYTPVTPLTKDNARCLARQRETLLTGVPPPDFPGGVGETGFKYLGTSGDIMNDTGRRAVGLMPFQATSEMSEARRALVKEANAILGF